MQKVSRLINSFTPSSYDLSITLERKARTFHGVVSIQGISQQANTLRLHAKGLTIESATIDGQFATVSSHDNDEIELSCSVIKNGSHTAVLSFSGSITDSMHGLYPCYFEVDGEKQELLATQFESHHAREVFPCVDEPEAKSTFNVTLMTEKNVQVLGNMPVELQREEEDMLLTKFETSPLMSSYLLAWVVGDLHKSTAPTKGGVEVNVWGTRAQPVESFSFALDIATRTIDFFDDYFGVKYPLAKSDHVALPDFSSGAMENWGLITYREATLLAYPGNTSISMKQRIATVVAHELSHQWFGNLVTMKWWNNLWLNESFATLMEYLAIDSIQPSWDIWLEFASYESLLALRRDALEGVQAVQVDVNHPDEINTLFDGAIVYAKGARLLRMLERYVGSDAFRSGLQQYFKTFAYKNTEADDLWKCLAEASGKDIASFMQPWITQSGYPVVHVENDSLTQEQFFIGSHTESEKVWPIPLNSSNDEAPLLLDSKTTNISMKPLERLNTYGSSHFAVHYNDEHLKSLLDSVQTLSPIERLQLIHEQTLLARGGVTLSSSLLPTIDAYKNETVEHVWDMVALALGELKKFVEEDAAAEHALRSLAGKVAKKEFARLGWDALENESESDTKLRATILGLMIYSENTDVLEEAHRRFSIDTLSTIPAEIRSLVISVEVRYYETATLLSDLLKAHKKTASSDLQQDIAAGLSSTKNVETIKRLLDCTKDTSVVRSQDAVHWFVYLIRNKYGRTTSWQWLKDNWDWVVATFGGDKSYDDYARYAASSLTTTEQLEEYKAFFTPMLGELSLKRTILIGIGEIEARVQLLERDGRDVRDKLSTQSA